MHIFNMYFCSYKTKTDVLLCFIMYLLSCVPHKEFRLQFQNSGNVQIYIYMCAHGFIMDAFEGN